MGGWSYRSAGVDIDKGDALIDRIKPLIRNTRTALTVSELGGFSGLCQLPPNLQAPLLVSSTDGVGTKLKIAFLMDIHDTVGIDLVAMSVNDIITSGAKPLFFLDYLATSKLDVEQGYQIIKGVSEGCRLAGCALIGGETAEMPDFYAKGEYDLAGFAVGVVERSKLVDGTRIRAGDTAIGLPSSGLHANGYSLARKVLIEHAGLALDQHIDELGETLGTYLLKPTVIYVEAIEQALATDAVHGLCHITGGGLPGNLPRILPPGLGLEIDETCWDIPPIFQVISQRGNVSHKEMLRTFNMGIGFVVLAATEKLDSVLSALTATGMAPLVIGKVVSESRPRPVRFV